MKTKGQTMDEFLGNPPGTFKKFIEKEEEKLREIERERKERIRNARKDKNNTDT